MVAGLVATVAASPARAQAGDALAVRVGGQWVTWWEAARAPLHWPRPDSTLASAVAWRPAGHGMEWGELSLRGVGTAWRLRLILVRVDPMRVAFRMLVPPRRPDGFAGRWSLQDTPREAILALNAGQFTSGPWGWLVQGGVATQRPGTGLLAPGVAFGAKGAVRMLPQDSLATLTGVTEGFQSYPTLLWDGMVPVPLRVPERGVDLEHRDSRLAIGLLSDGRLLVVLTRFEGLGGALEVVPFGLTTPEMAAVMGGLGARRAVLLDGGLSGQLLLREQGLTRQWPGLRGVAAALAVFPRQP